MTNNQRRMCLRITPTGEDCFFYAVTEPKGYTYLFPSCIFHINSSNSPLFKASLPEETEICPICLKDLKESQDLVQLSCCKKFYCSPCIKETFKTKKECPSCRGPACGTSSLCRSQERVAIYNKVFTPESFKKHYMDMVEQRTSALREHVSALAQLRESREKTNIPEVLEGISQAIARIQREYYDLMVAPVIPKKLIIPTFQKIEDESKRKQTEDHKGSSSKMIRLD